MGCSLPEKLCFGSLALLNRLIVARCTGITKLSNADLLNFAFGCGQDAVFDFSSVPKLKRFVMGANKRQLHYVFTRSVVKTCSQDEEFDCQDQVCNN